MDSKFEETEPTVSLHGLGFLQVKLGGGQRLHVWHPDLPRRRCAEHSQAHDHRFSFTSRVLVGRINNMWLTAEPVGVGAAPTHVAYKHEGERTKFGNRPWTPDGEFRLEAYKFVDVDAGGRYKMDAYDVHMTQVLSPDGRLATLMRKTFEGYEGARSFCSVGVEPDADFDRFQMSEKDMWATVINVLGASFDVTDMLLLGDTP